MTQPLLCQEYLTAPDAEVTDHLTLSYEARFLRRKRLDSDQGLPLLIDLPQVTSLDQGGVLRGATGELIGIRAAPEPLLQVTGPDLVRLAWHIGNRHTPCQIETDRLIIQRDHVIETMLRHLGASVSPIEAPFTPEGGAYGHGRTHAHEHGRSTHTHSTTSEHHHAD